MPVPRKKALAGLLALLVLTAYACGGDSCDDEVLTDTELGADDVVLVEDQPKETPTATEEPRETPTPVESEPTPEPTPEPTEEPAATSTPEPTPDDEPPPTTEEEGEIINVLVDTYTWGQSQKTIALQEVLGITADGFYGSGTRSAHLTELENRGLSTAGVPDDPSSSSPGSNPSPTPTPSTPSPTPAPGSSYTPVTITQTTLSCSDVEFDWNNSDSTPDSWQVSLVVRANVGSGNPPSSLYVTKTRTVSGSSSSETFTSQEFHGQSVWVTLWGNGAPYTLTISRVDSGVVSTPRTSSGLMWDDC